MNIDIATQAELITAESRTFARLLDILDLGIQALQESQRFRTGPEADPKRCKEARAAYDLCQATHQQLHTEYMAIREEVQRRRRSHKGGGSLSADMAVARG